MLYSFETEIWRSQGTGGWFFVTVPVEVADGLRALSGPRAGFGSLRVRAEIGGQAWDTSVFPDARSRSFLLPLKAQVRRRVSVTAGDRIRLQIQIAI